MKQRRSRMGSELGPAAAEAGLEATPIVYVNGKRHVLPLGAGHTTLLSYLRGGRAAAAAAAASHCCASMGSCQRLCLGSPFH